MSVSLFEMLENLSYSTSLGDEADHAELASASVTKERVDFVHPTDKIAHLRDIGHRNRPHSGSPQRNEMLPGYYEGLPAARSTRQKHSDLLENQGHAHVGGIERLLQSAASGSFEGTRWLRGLPTKVYR